MLADATPILKQKHIKRKNPDKEVVIRQSRVRTTKNLTIISLTVQNKTITKNYIAHIYFSFRLYDKNGKVLKTGDSNLRETDAGIAGGETKTWEWGLANRLPRAKKIKIKFKKVEFGDTVWDY
ncbi:hypothetical protein EWM62_05200 [Mucilaginibacter terrigena]|uniref:Uncharacterized protein n=1 Tax=Mucilaginibacter terrigena TaxID=2492395 RepID=A0A4Q5LPU7_9SPHI|nr:hypothetical protein [Mucilaginibacter terrigena]RYU91339.1 hypothetical protein EWM62_05200 [Mucilaginibacter terrigena]